MGIDMFTRFATTVSSRGGVVLAHDQDLAVLVVDLEVHVRAVGLEVDAHRRDEVLGAVGAVDRQVALVVERELAVGAQQGLEDGEPLETRHRRDVAADLLEIARKVGIDAREARACLDGVVRMDADRHVAGALDVRHALREFIGEHLVHRLGILLEDVVCLAGRVVELTVADLVVAQRGVDDGELHRGVGGEIVVDIAHRCEDGLLVVIAGVLIGDIVEGEGLGVISVLDLADAVLEHSVVADRIDHVLRVVTAAALLGGEFIAL